MSKKATEFQKKEMSKMYRGKEIFKPLNTGWIDDHVACVREWVANIFFYRKGDTMRATTTTALPKKWAGSALIRSRYAISLAPIRTPTMWARWSPTVRDCSGTQNCT